MGPHTHRKSARSIAFSSHNDALMISVGEDARLIFWDVPDSRQIREVNTESPLSSVSYHADGYLLAAGTSDGVVLIYDLRMLVSKSQPALPLHRLKMHQEHGGGNLEALAFAPLGFSHGRSLRPALSSTLAGPTRTSERLSDKLHKDRGEIGGASREASAHSFRGGLADASTGPTPASMHSMMNRLSSRASVAVSRSKDGDMNTSAVPPLTKPPPLSSSPCFMPRTGPLSGKDVHATSVVTPSEQLDADRHWDRHGDTTPNRKSSTTRSEVNLCNGSGDASAQSVAEALQPFLRELQNQLCNEIREAHYASLEQNFRLHAELRQDVDELRTEVQMLRSELSRVPGRLG